MAKTVGRGVGALRVGWDRVVVALSVVACELRVDAWVIAVDICNAIDLVLAAPLLAPSPVTRLH